MRPTFHLVPEEVWDSSDPASPYAATSLAGEGFIHCTDGDAQLLATANRHYRADPRPFLALTVDLETTGSPWRIDDADRIYPHIFGTIDRASVSTIARLIRAADGTFVAIGDPR